MAHPDYRLVQPSKGGGITFQSPTSPRFGQLLATAFPLTGRARGTGWQVRQKYDDRFMKRTRVIGVPHRLQGRPAWP